MKVLVDTSAWVDLLNGSPTREAVAVLSLLAGDGDPSTCGLVVTEVFQGLRQAREREEIADRFRELTYFESSDIDLYFRAADIYRTLRERGQSVRSTIDCLIVGLAEAHGAAILARDRDIDTILASGLMRVERWLAKPSSGP